LGITIKRNVFFNDKEEQLAFLKSNNVSGWVADPKGINTAGYGLILTAMDMAKIDQLYLVWRKMQWQTNCINWMDKW
jgi:hypothetical protein